MKKLILIFGLLLSLKAAAWDNINPSAEDEYLLEQGYVDNNYRYINKIEVEKEYKKINAQIAQMYPMQINRETYYDGITITSDMVIYLLTDLTVNNKEEFSKEVVKKFYDQQLTDSACALWDRDLHKQNNKQMAFMVVRAKNGSIIYKGETTNILCFFP